MSKSPPNLVEASERDLLAKDGAGAYTFSNGTEWECWAEPNCLRCKYYDLDAAGKDCAFEGAALLHMVSPALAELFGWVQNPEYATYRAEYDKGERCHGWDAPESCPFFSNRSDDDGDEPRATPPDPAQLVLIVDPTEDLALATLPKEHPVHV
jgi:hypothetical protein